MKPFGDIRDRMPPACPITGYDCGKKECDPAHSKCGFPPAPLNQGHKIWGVTTPLVVTPMYEMHRLEIKPWHVCSIHTHQFKHNAFYVLSGTLYIDVWGDGQRVAHHKLVPGIGYAPAHLTVRPGVRHRFRTGMDEAVALEMYYTEPLSEDIQRENEGGPI